MAWVRVVMAEVVRSGQIPNSYTSDIISDGVSMKV